MISNCGHDENNRYNNGAAGDQTGGEWTIIPWYNRPWRCVLRHPDAKVREKQAQLAEAAARNDKIGYDQSERDTFGRELAKAGYDPSKITVKCETDCSKGIIDITKAIGHLLGINALKQVNATYTGNMRSAYRSAGYQVLTESKYLTSDAYLLRGDILLNDECHTATNLTDGSKAVTSAQSGGGQSASTSTTATYTVRSGDSLWAIAEKYYKDGSRYGEIKAANGLPDNMIYPGQVLKIPGVGGSSTYTVKSGDSLWAIAERYLGDGSKYEEIKAANGLKDNMIYPGQVLKIPK